MCVCVQDRTNVVKEELEAKGWERRATPSSPREQFVSDSTRSELKSVRMSYKQQKH